MSLLPQQPRDSPADSTDSLDLRNTEANWRRDGVGVVLCLANDEDVVDAGSLSALDAHYEWAIAGDHSHGCVHGWRGWRPSALATSWQGAVAAAGF